MGFYYSNCSIREPHVGFIGRWSPFHVGHTWIIEKVRREKDRPVLIMVRDTVFDDYTASERAEIVKAWFEENRIRGSIIIVPDIEGIYYGRGVGYNIEEIEPPRDIRVVSATEIRKMIGENNDQWKQMVAKGTSGILEKTIKDKECQNDIETAHSSRD